MSYERQIPRDLINDAKLMNALTRLSCCIHDGRFHPVNIRQELTSPELGLVIEVSENYTGLICSNYHVYVGDRKIALFLGFDSGAEPYPLYFVDELEPENGAVEVFDYYGIVTKEFRLYIAKLDPSTF